VGEAHVTIAGPVTDEPRSGRSDNGNDWIEFTIAIPVPGTDWHERVTVWGHGMTAIRAAESIRKGDKVIVRASSMRAESWMGQDADGKPKAFGRITVRATSIGLSFDHDTAFSGRTLRNAPGGVPADASLPTDEQADLEVLAGVTT
jgi:single-stranded DNA-binding protein